MSEEHPITEWSGVATAAFESGALPIDVIVVWRNAGGWHASTVLHRNGGEPPKRHPRWPEPFLSDGDQVDKEWHYLADRIRTGHGGNGYSYELTGFETDSIENIGVAVTAMAAEVVAASEGPFGEIAGTILFDQPGDKTIVVMPFVVLPDDRGHTALVAAGNHDDPNVSGPAGPPIEPIPFRSVEHWQRNGAPSWPLQPRATYTLTWATETARIRIGADGTLQPLDQAHDDETTGGADRFVIHRVAPPSWLDPPNDDRPEDPSTLGLDGWTWAVPMVHRALASPKTGEAMPQAPRRPEDHDPGATGYWTALLHLLLYSFGWTRPDRGMRWWYDAGKPTDDRRLQLIRQVWDADGQLDLFAAWLWTRPVEDFLAAFTDFRSEHASVEVDRRWLEDVHRLAETHRGHSPFNPGEGDSLHLWFHAILDAPESIEGTLIRTSRTDHRAVVLLDSLRGWYPALVRLGADLPSIGQRSWHVDVVIRPIGCMGTYRESRVTGLWFSGPHRLHTKGI